MHAEGCVYGSSGGIQAYGNGSHAEGYAYSGGVQAIGAGAHAEGFGQYGTIIASGTGAHAEGYITKALATGAHAEGQGTAASGTCSHASGYYTRATGNYSEAHGGYTAAIGGYSEAHGYYTSANTAYSYVIGRYNAACASGELFTVGNGTGTGSSLKTGFKIVDSNGSSFGGNVIVTVNGHVNATNGFFQTSDINKKNVVGELDLDKAYDLIDKCQEILYTLKNEDSDKVQIGMIAQEIQEFFPELISEDNDGSLSLDYSRLTVVILRVLKDIIKRISKLEGK